MRKLSNVVLAFLFSFAFMQQSAMAFDQAYTHGEELTFKLYYNSAITGNVTAGKMVAKVQQSPVIKGGKSLTHIVLEGETKGAFRWFFKANDRYETYVETKTQLPYYFKKRIQEGGYEASSDVVFTQENGKIRVQNNRSQSVRDFKTEHQVQDLLSVLYFIRNYDFAAITLNQKFEVNLFMDDSVYQIQFEFTGYEEIKTSLGYTRCLKFAPHVLTGGVFADETPMTIFVSDDKNRLPILAEGDLMIGRARIELVSFSGLANVSSAISSR